MQMVLGYIITDRKLLNIKGFVRQVSDMSMADPTKPVLVVGWEKAKNLEGYKNILTKQISERIFWTFKKNEDRSSFNADLELFYSYIIDYALRNVKYYYINPLRLKISSVKKIINYVKSPHGVCIYISNDMVYMLYEGTSVCGFSLKILDYIGVKHEKILDLIRSNKNNKIFDETSSLSLKMSRLLPNKRYALAYFISQIN